MKKRLNEYLNAEAKKIVEGISNMSGQEEKIHTFISNRLAVVYYEGCSDTLSVARRIVVEKKEGGDAII